MKSATALLLTLCLSGALETASQSDFSAELGNLKTTVEAQAQAIAGLTADLDATKTDLINYKGKAEEKEKKLAGNNGK